MPADPIERYGDALAELEAILDALNQHCSQVRLVRFDDSGRALESSFRLLQELVPLVE